MTSPHFLAAVSSPSIVQRPSVDTVSTDGHWTIEGLEAAAKKWGDVTWEQSLGIS